jgi:signal transduction histidine kinase
MFSRGSNKYQGTGIGLALVRKVMDRMGGRVGVESELGKGSRFWIELPAAYARSEPPSTPRFPEIRLNEVRV